MSQWTGPLFPAGESGEWDCHRGFGETLYLGGKRTGGCRRRSFSSDFERLIIPERKRLLSDPSHPLSFFPDRAGCHPWYNGRNNCSRYNLPPRFRRRVWRVPYYCRLRSDRKRKARPRSSRTDVRWEFRCTAW